MDKRSMLWGKQLRYELTEKTLSSGKVILTFPGLPENLYEAVSANAEKNPDKIALKDSFGRVFSYGALAKTAGQFASALKYEFGVRRGSHVALMMYSSAEFAVAFLALAKLGATAVMLPTKYRKKEICALTDRADVDQIICDTDYEDYFEKYKKKGIRVLKYHSSENGFGFDGLIKNGFPDTACEGRAEDISVMMFTSGTTSFSKGVMIANYSYMHAVAAYQKIFAVTERDSAVIPVPIYMITGLAALFGLMLFSGGTVYLQQFFHAEKVLQCVRDNQVTFMHAAPTVYMMLLEKREEFPELPSLRCLACGGSQVRTQMIKRIHEWLPSCEFRTVYGMTETSSPATILPEDAVKSPHMESDGIPIPGTEVRIVRDDGTEAEPGEYGEILLKGTNLLTCYYKLDTPLYRDGWLRTGDVGYLTEDGYCYVVDRIKDMINRGGEKIVSSDVEKELLEMDGMEEAAVIALPHPVYGEAPAAVVKLNKDGKWDEKKVKQYLKGRMAGYKIPEHIMFVDQIPLTPNGKYDKKNMKRLFEM